jgi:hypothetical protein
MSEMQQMMAVISNLPANLLSKNPAGSWSFCGRVDARLLLVMRDGTDVPSDLVRKCQRHGRGLFPEVRTRVWQTREDAETYAASLGIEVR